MEFVMPNDLSTAQSLLHAQHVKIAELLAEVQHLKAVAAKFQHMLFGQKSERHIGGGGDQLGFQWGTETLQAPAREPEAASEKEPTTRPRRKPLPAHLPRERREIQPGHTCCPDCGGTLKPLGEDVSEQLEYVPAHWKVIQYARAKLACTCCERIVQAPAPSQPIPRSIAAPGLLAHVLVSKFCDHLPLHRQSEIYARQDIHIERSTMAGWVKHCHELLRPLLGALRQHVFAAQKLHTDDTPLAVLAPSRTALGRLWVYGRDDRPAGDRAPAAVWFAFSPNRKGEHPREHLKDFKGTLQADAYTGYTTLYESGSIEEAACWAHLRRKFVDVHRKNASPLAWEAIEQIGALYAIERSVRGQPPPVRVEARKRALPLIGALHAWMEATLASISKKSDLAQAIRYALSRWASFQRYATDGLLEIDNNAAERSLRPVALGRKNYLFVGSQAGGERAATFYSLIGTAKLNGVDPERYLREVFARIADHSISRIAELLPWNIALDKS